MTDDELMMLARIFAIEEILIDYKGVDVNVYGDLVQKNLESLKKS